MLHILYDIGIYGAQPELACKRYEYRVVELHYLAGTTPVGILGYHMAMHLTLLCKLLRHILDYERGVGIAETVDGLLFVAYYQIVVARGKRLPYKRTEIKPLYPRRILELVDKEIAQPYAETRIFISRHFRIWSSTSVRMEMPTCIRS